MKNLRKIIAVFFAAIMIMSCAVVTSYAKGQSRYSVLVLDVSGSMSGARITELKKAAKNFCDDVINSANGDENYIAITTFASSTRVVCDFTDELNKLNEAIDSLSSGGGTDLAGGIRTGASCLVNVPESAIKNVFIMSDGAPTTGEDNAYSAVSEIPINCNVYAGYICPNGEDSDAVRVMTNVGRNGYWPIPDGDNIQVILASVWSNIAQNNNANVTVIRIACPVDVSVELNGVVLDKNNPKTLFGTMEFEGPENDQTKIVTLSYRDDYNIKVVGTGTGTMDYSISYYCNDEELYTLTYPTVDITPSTIVTGKVNFDDKEIKLAVDNDSDGIVDKNISAKTEESGGSGSTLLGVLLMPFVTIWGLLVSFFVITFGGVASLFV